MKLTDAINKISSHIENEQFLLEPLCIKSASLAEQYPWDQTSVQMARFFQKKAEKSLTISKTDINSAYRNYFTTNNKFAANFDSLLTKTELAKPKVIASFAETELKPIVDKSLVEDLSGFFNKETDKPLSPALANLAIKSCLTELNKFECPPCKVSVAHANDKIAICLASFLTPKGESSVYIPIEVLEKQALLPTVFLSKQGFLDLNKEDLHHSIRENAGIKQNVNLHSMLNLITTAKFGIKSTNKVADIVLKTKLDDLKTQAIAKDKSSIKDTFFSIDKEANPIKLNTEYQSLSNELLSKTSEAKYKFGSAFTAAKDLLVSSLNKFGYNCQVSVADVDDETVYYAVAINNNVFKTPIKIANNKFNLPEIILIAGNIMPFNKDSIESIIKENKLDYETLSSVSPAYELKASELINIIKEATNEKNYQKAEIALDALYKNHTKNDYQAGYNLYLSALNGSKKAEAKCSKPIKTATSQYLVCSHTGLPVHKVYQDKYGNCLRKI